MKSLVLLCVLMMRSAVSAQDYTSLYDTTPSRFSYGSYTTSDGGYGTVSYNRIGRYTYGYASDGSQSTTTQIGNRSYTDIWIAPKPMQYKPNPIWEAPKPIRYDVDRRMLWWNRSRD